MRYLVAITVAACGPSGPPPGPPSVSASDVPECHGVSLAVPSGSDCLGPDAAQAADACLSAMTRRSFELALASRSLSRARAEERSFEIAAGRGRAPGELFDHAGEEGEVTLLALGEGTEPPRSIATPDQRGASRDVPLSPVSALVRDSSGRVHPVDLAPTLVQEQRYVVCECPPPPPPTEPGPPPRFWAYELPRGTDLGPPVRVPFELHIATTRPGLTADNPICR